MNFETAYNLKKEISNKFLFSNELVSAFAGSWYEDPTPLDMIYEIFQGVSGVSISGTDETGYHIVLLSENTGLYLTPLREYYDIGVDDIKCVYSTPFSLRSRKRPLEIGCSVSHNLNRIKGTLGCFVKNMEDGEIYILSNHHVLYNSDDLNDNFVVQPCTIEGGCSSDSVGLYKRSLPFYRSEINEYDAAIAGPISVDINYQIPHALQYLRDLTDAKNERMVYKVGAETNLTYGKIESRVTDIRIWIDGERYDFSDQILVKGLESDNAERQQFSQEGDSGSIIIDNETHKAIGLLFAGNSIGDTLANPIGPVFSKLNISFPDFGEKS